MVGNMAFRYEVGDPISVNGHLMTIEEIQLRHGVLTFVASDGHRYKFRQHCVQAAHSARGVHYGNAEWNEDECSYATYQIDTGGYIHLYKGYYARNVRAWIFQIFDDGSKLIGQAAIRETMSRCRTAAQICLIAWGMPDSHPIGEVMELTPEMREQQYLHREEMPTFCYAAYSSQMQKAAFPLLDNKIYNSHSGTPVGWASEYGCCPPVRERLFPLEEKCNASAVKVGA